MIINKIIEHGSNAYEDMIQLRMDVLLNPIGIPESYIDREKEKEDILIGAYIDDSLIGCCILTQKSYNTYQLRQMAVKKDLQGEGIGASIVRFSEKIARDNQMKKLILHARNAVIPFYSKCGYQIEGDEFFEVGIGHHTMYKNLI
jgi:predicted GNAT family N-acyltransferase